MGEWLDALHDDPIPWLLEETNPVVRHLTLRQLLDRPIGDPEVRMAGALAMQSGPTAAILAAQDPAGYWVKPGGGYAPKYRGTVWQVIFLDQLGADGHDERVRRAGEYVLSHAQTTLGGFGVSRDGSAKAPPPGMTIHCLTGNLLRALIGFGWLENERVQRAFDWQARAVTGEEPIRYYQSGACGPLFACAANEKRPCGWSAIKVMLGLARVPADRRAPHVQRAIEAGREFLLGCDPAVADYPLAWGNQKPSGSWFKLGFPSGYVADVLQNLEALCELGLAGDGRLNHAIEWLLSKQDERGRWKNEYAYQGKTWIDIDQQGAVSKWVTLRACRVLKAVYG